MRLLLDACALYPRLMRGALLGYAEAGGFAPLWSARILEEWRRAAERKQGPAAAMEAEAVAARMRARFPQAEATGWEAVQTPERLPDPGDAHVLAAAVAGGADGIVTLNIRDFPLRALGARRLARLHPDAFLRAEWTPGGALDAVLDEMAAAAPDLDFARALKAAGLPRLAKARRGAG
ncbi:MAG: RSP_2648 family PIN domain-containing protein [Rubrimonas sp.]|uniref:RSP_2648 family PIN domain-containing protein n=1 Tax=Rubrimonas sp. TaxID=2036015 RepID=UPI002FDCC9C2